MEKKSNIAMLILGSAAAFTLYKFYSMSKEERNDFIDTIKTKTQNLLDDAENTVEKVEQYVGQIKSKAPDEWLDKLYLVKKMFSDLYMGEQSLVGKAK